MDPDTQLPALLEGRIVETIGDNRIVYEILAARNIEEATDWARRYRPSRRCQHDYDCCGRFYPEEADVYLVGDFDPGPPRYVIRQGWYLNV